MEKSGEELYHFEDYAVIILDSNFRIIDWNAKAFELLSAHHPCERSSSLLDVIPVSQQQPLQNILTQKGKFSFTLSKEEGSTSFIIHKLSNKQKEVLGYRVTLEQVVTKINQDNDPQENDIQQNTQHTIKRTFVNIRIMILQCLTKGQFTINQISHKTSINWKTVENHLTYLLGRGLVHEVLKSEYVRIFEITEEGRIFINKFQKNMQQDVLEVEK